MTRFNISKIEIENFRSIQSKVTLDINPGLFAIEGINNDEKNSTNGCGKTTLVSALYWCLTGNTLTNEVLADEVVNIKVGKNCKVVTYIDSDQGEVKITRTRKHSELGNNLLLEIAGQNLSCHKMTDTQERLNQLLKVPVNLLHSTIIMTSDMKSAFSDLTPQQRIQTLESIRDYSIWDKVRDEANKDIKLYNKEISDLNLEISKTEGSKETYSQLLTKNIINLFGFLDENVSEEKIREVSEKINAQILENKEKIIQNNEQITRFSNEIETISTLFSTKMTNDSTLFTTKDEISKEKLDKIVDDANKLKLEGQRLEYEKKDLEKELQTIEKWFVNDKCPTCGKTLDRTEKDIQEKTEQKQNILSKIEIISQNLKNNSQSVQEKREEWQLLNKKYQEQETNKKNQEAERYKKLQEQTLENDKQKKVFQTQIDALKLVNKGLEDENKTKEASLKEIDTIQTYQDEIKKLEEFIINTKKQVDTLKGKKDLSEYFYKLLGSKGELRPYLLNKDIQYLNHCMQKYIVCLFKNTNVNLVLNGATIDILIDSSGIKKNVSSLSGGEKKRLNLAIQLALYDLLISTSQVSFNILWLDEVESQLDSLGVQQLIDIIEDKSEEISSVFWITNNPMVKENISKKIICKKTMGKTEVEYQ